MKSLLLLSILVSTLAHAQVVSREAFARLSDSRKVAFLNQNAEEKTLTSRQLNGALVKRLKLAALQEAGVWGDTVLEGPYAQTGEVEISEAVALMVKGQIYAYRFTIRAAAIFTEGEGCEFNDDSEEWSEECFENAGAISEQVSFDFNGTEFDEGSYAEFED